MAPNLGGADHVVYTIETKSSPRITNASLKSNEEEKVNTNQKAKKINVVNMVLLGLAQFLGGLTYSLLSSFYTEEATKKGLSFTQCGLVYGSLFVTIIIFSPLLSKYIIDRIGSRQLFLSGTFLAGGCTALFGTLQLIDDANLFFGLSLAIRVVSAIGESAFFCAIYPLVTREAPKQYRSTALSVMETLHGFGLMIGPFVGGLLYELNGFYFPFVTCGGTLASLAVVAACFLKDHKSSKELEEDTLTSTKSTQYVQLFKMPSVIICCLLLICAETSVAWYLPTLQPMLDQRFQMTPMETGAMFMVEGATYALFSPIWGYLLDKKMGPFFPLVCGSIGVTIGYALLGPVPFLDSIIPSNIYTVVAGLFIQGACVASTFITTLVFMLNDSVAQGAPDTEQTRAMITSLWFISENIAGYLGSSLGGYTFDVFGFSNSSYVVIGMQILALLLASGLFAFRQRKGDNSERQSLLHHKMSAASSKTGEGNADYQSIVIA